MKRRTTLTIRGECHEWCVNSDMSQGQIDAMRKDGVEVGIVYHSVPGWIVACGLMRPWCFFEDVFNFRNPMAK